MSIFRCKREHFQVECLVRRPGLLAVELVSEGGHVSPEDS